MPNFLIVPLVMVLLLAFGGGAAFLTIYGGTLPPALRGLILVAVVSGTVYMTIIGNKPRTSATVKISIIVGFVVFVLLMWGLG